MDVFWSVFGCIFSLLERIWDWDLLCHALHACVTKHYAVGYDYIFHGNDGILLILSVQISSQKALEAAKYEIFMLISPSRNNNDNNNNNVVLKYVCSPTTIRKRECLTCLGVRRW